MMQFTITSITERDDNMVNMEVEMDTETRDHLLSYGLRRLLEDAVGKSEEPYVYSDWDHSTEQPDIG